MPTSNNSIQRDHHIIDRSLEYLTEAELTRQIGYGVGDWPIVLVKELIDNALDATEQTARAPVIDIIVTDDYVQVCDNGPGLPATVIEKALDYTVRISDKTVYVSPSRGQLGNALKCVFAAPFVVDGNEGRVVITTADTAHDIRLRLDRIAQRPVIEHQREMVKNAKNGTQVA